MELRLSSGLKFVVFSSADDNGADALPAEEAGIAAGVKDTAVAAVVAADVVDVADAVTAASEVATFDRDLGALVAWTDRFNTVVVVVSMTVV